LKLPVGMIDDEMFYLTERTQIHHIVKILNLFSIEWQVNDPRNSNVFSLKTGNNIYFLFDLETGYITKIALQRF
jgi:hypothetical protein